MSRPTDTLLVDHNRLEMLSRRLLTVSSRGDEIKVLIDQLSHRLNQMNPIPSDMFDDPGFRVWYNIDLNSDTVAGNVGDTISLIVSVFDLCESSCEVLYRFRGLRNLTQLHNLLELLNAKLSHSEGSVADILDVAEQAMMLGYEHIVVRRNEQQCHPVDTVDPYDRT